MVGRLDTWLTGTGFEITPIVGLVRPPDALVPDPVEVAERPGEDRDDEMGRGRMPINYENYTYLTPTRRMRLPVFRSGLMLCWSISLALKG